MTKFNNYFPFLLLFALINRTLLGIPNTKLKKNSRQIFYINLQPALIKENSTIFFLNLSN